MKLAKMSPKGKVFGQCLIFLSLLGLLYLYSIMKDYPKVEFEFTSSNPGESLCIYYDNGEQGFDENHVVYDNIKEGRNYYSFQIPNSNLLRIDIGNSAGIMQIGNIKINSLFVSWEICTEAIQTSIFSQDVGTVKVEEGGDVLIESTGSDPCFILGNIHEQNGKINIISLGILFLVVIIMVIVSIVIAEHYEKVQNAGDNLAKIDEKNQWRIITIVFTLASIIRYFYRLNAWPDFVDDELITFRAAYGYLRTGTFYMWDFANDCISEILYNRAWPHTVLLAAWMKVFGVSEVACRALSAVMGVAFILSCIFITKKFFKNIRITLVTISIILANSSITYLFRFTRMYAMLLVVSLWMIYFAFQALTVTNHISVNAENKLLIFIKNNFDFHIGYVISALSLFYIGVKIHINCMILCLGIYLFVIYKSFKTRERKYIIVAIIASSIAVLTIIGLFFEPIKAFPILGQIIVMLEKSSAWFSNIRQEYLLYILSEFGSKLIAVFLLTIYIVVAGKNILKKKNDDITDKMVYMGNIMILTIIFFSFFTIRYYAARYIIMIVSVSAMIYAVGFEICYKYKRIAGLFIGICLVFMFGKGFKTDFEQLYTQYNYSNYLPAYATISEFFDLKTETVPVAIGGIEGAANFYLSQLVSSQVPINIHDTNGMDVLIESSEEYSEGILTCERIKISHLRQGIYPYLFKWSDYLSGEELDNYNMEIAHYHFIDGQPIDEDRIYIDKYDMYLDEENKNIIIYIDLGALEEDAEIFCIRISAEMDGGKYTTRAFQLKLPENKNGCYRYILSDKLFEVCDFQKIEMDNRYAIYKVSGWQEFIK